jgi:hypothetical protein
MSTQDKLIITTRPVRTTTYRGSYDENHNYVGIGDEPPQKGRGLFAIKNIPIGTEVCEYGHRGQILNQAEKDEEQTVRPNDKWLQISKGASPMYINGSGTLGGLINHGCGRTIHCPANVQLQRDDRDNYVAVTSIKHITEGTWLALDYNFSDDELYNHHPDQQWWQHYICPQCGRQ